MMKKILFSLAFTLSGIIMLNAQCIPDSTVISPGIYPDTATNLPFAYATITYNTTMTAVIPVDTVYLGFPITIDSIGITGITGLPTGFDFTPNTPSGYWPGGGKGCILISGTASQLQVGTYNLVINTKAYGGGLQVPTPVNGYKIIVKDTILGINEGNEQGGISFITYSDPFNNSIIVKIHSLSFINDASIIINDITGRELMQINNLYGTDFMINKGWLSKGIYIISLMNKEKILARGKIFSE